MILGPLDAALRTQVRPRVQRAFRSRVAGEDYLEHADRIWNTVGPRWFTPEDPIWWVHASPAMFVGGIRALLVQSLHPLAMAGVAGHSGYKSDPWGRLHRTSTYIATTTYGTIADAERVIARVQGVHRRIRGTAPDGRRYAADDPHLLAWVHAAEAESFLVAHQELAPVALTPDEADRYVEQIGTVAARLGVLDPPRTVGELDAVLAAYRPDLEASPAALEAADFLLRHPPLPLTARAPYAALAAGAVALTPPWARDLLGLPSGPGLERAQLGAGRLVTAFIGWAMDHPSTQGQWQRDPTAAPPKDTRGRGAGATAADTPQAGKSHRSTDLGQAGSHDGGTTRVLPR